MSLLARLTHRKYRSARSLRAAHRLLRLYAREHELPLDWCDAVLNHLLDAHASA